MRIAFRCDASVEIGSGHLMRCLTLADALKRRGAECVFLAAPSPMIGQALIEARGHRFRPLAVGQQGAVPSSADDLAHAHWLPWGWEADAAAVASALPETMDWMVVDHYALDHRWEARLRTKASRIMVIDDLADRHHDCDLLLDHNVSNLWDERYDGLVPLHCQRMLGPAHALINPAFATARRNREAAGPVMRLLLFVTAGDPLNLTAQLIRQLSAEKWSGLTLDVVTGAVNSHLAELQALCAARPGTALHVDTAGMPLLCARADIAIGAAGGAALERSASALPSLTLVLAENQRHGAEALAALGAVDLLRQSAPDDITALDRQLGNLINNNSARQTIGLRAAILVDGLGAERVADAIVSRRAPIHLRRALALDAMWLLDLRNHPSTRIASLSTDIVPLPSHLEWLDKALRDPARLLLIGMIGDQRIGTTRFDFGESRKATVSISIDPEFQGRGLAPDLLRQSEHWAMAHQPALNTIAAVVRQENSRSRKLFSTSGYVPVEPSTETLIFQKQV
jgi:UDP-2,4-diacetamido-2,4,6-trideoxy-beta-L-altropyranose hydrolase